MKESMYASVGKSVLIRAIGLQDNHKTKNELDRKASGCFSCQYFKDSLKNPCNSKCAACASKLYAPDKYVNEKNRYGYQHPLSLCGTKLLVYLHFCSVTGAGVIEDVLIRSAAERLGVSQRSIHNCLKALEEHQYIVYAKNGYGPGHYTVILNSYEDYFKTASEGGRGYVVFSAKLMDELIKTESINQLRLYIRMYLNIDSKKYLPLGFESFISDQKDIHDITRYFPKYFKPCHVRKLLKKHTELFSIQEKSNNAITYLLDKKYYGELDKKTYYSECTAMLADLIQQTNDILSAVFEHEASLGDVPSVLQRQVVEAKKLGTKFSVVMNSKDIEDLGQLSTQYGYIPVKQALMELWTHNRIPELPSKYGELTRSIIEKRTQAA